LKEWAKKGIVSWDTLHAQAFFTMYELEQPQYAVLKGDLRLGLKSLETLTLDFCDTFERPSASGRQPDKRIAYAHDCLAIMMRDLPAPHVPTIPGVPTMPTSIETALLQQLFQMLAPLIESAVAGLIKGLATHIPGAVVNTAGMVTLDPASLAKMIEAEITKIQAGKPL
jgi:hypothetical protein